MENNCNIIFEGERPLIHLVRPTTKEEKITQYDMIHTRLYLLKVACVANIKLFFCGLILL